MEERTREEGATRHQPTSKKSPTVSAVLSDGRLIELVHDATKKETAFAVWKDGIWSIERKVKTPDGETLVPYAATNNLIRNEVVLLPARPELYESEEALVLQIQDFIHRYVDVGGRFERVAAFYVLLTWLHDCFNELPYLRLRGDYGSGKTRFLQTVGSLCYKPIFASGASTVSPIFHTLDAFGGTLIVDEGDFRFSDEKADIVKILNNGNVKGLPVLRCETFNGKEYNPRAFHVYGPKIVGMRGHYDDRALESRFITEETGVRKMRADIPINLPASYKAEALALRNKLLLYRFRNHSEALVAEPIADDSVEPRLRQVLGPLAAVTFDDTVRSDLWALARETNADLLADRGMAVEAQLLAVIRYRVSLEDGTAIKVGDIARDFRTAFASEYEREITNKWIGSVLRRRLALRTRKSNGVYVIPITEMGRLAPLYARYGVEDEDADAVADAVGDDFVWERNP